LQTYILTIAQLGIVVLIGVYFNPPFLYAGTARNQNIVFFTTKAQKQIHMDENN
jgi:hypothetical protein